MIARMRASVISDVGKWLGGRSAQNPEHDDEAQGNAPMIIRIGVDALIAERLLSSLEEWLLMLGARRRS
jgi:hypothetical protein